MQKFSPRLSQLAGEISPHDQMSAISRNDNQRYNQTHTQHLGPPALQQEYSRPENFTAQLRASSVNDTKSPREETLPKVNLNKLAGIKTQLN